MHEEGNTTILRTLREDLNRYVDQLTVFAAAVAWIVLAISVIAGQFATTDLIMAAVFTIVAVFRRRFPYLVKVGIIIAAVGSYGLYSITQVGFFGLGPIMFAGAVVVSIVFLEDWRAIPIVAFPGFVFMIGAAVVATGVYRFDGDGASRLNDPIEWLIHGLIVFTLSFFTYSAITYMRNRIQTTVSNVVTQSEELRRLAYTDRLTGLANDAFFERHIRERIAGDAHHGYLIVADIFRFGSVNSLYGYEYGNTVLATLGTVLEDLADENEIVARLQSDQFGMWIEDDNEHRLNERIRRVQGWVERALIERGALQRLHFHVGVAAYPSDGDDFETCSRNAGIAVNVAKRQRDFRTVYFQPHMLNDVTLEATINRLLQRSIDRNELAVAYQPKVDVHSGAWVGLEALARWSPAEIGEVSPATFIPIATQHRMIVSLGKRIVERVFSDIPLINATLGPVPTSINVSPHVFLLADYPHYMIDTAEQFGVDPASICLEITEDIFVHDIRSVEAAIETLRSSGFRIAIDDFGKGYSSLYYISTLRFDELKVDKSFVDRIDSDHKRFGLFQSICAIADTYSMTVVAEGVENEEQAVAVKRSRCPTAQGYHYVRPQPLSNLVMYSSAP